MWGTLLSRGQRPVHKCTLTRPVRGATGGQQSVALPLVTTLSCGLHCHEMLLPVSMDHLTPRQTLAAAGIAAALGIFLLLALTRYSSAGKRAKNFPPGPPCVPILGNLHQVPMTKAFVK